MNKPLHSNGHVPIVAHVGGAHSIFKKNHQTFLLGVHKLLSLAIELWLHVLNCSEYHHLLCWDLVTTATRLVSVELIMFSILRQTMTYAPSIHNTLDSLWLKL
jgi:hypothetical protein